MGLGGRRRLLPTFCRNRLSTRIRVQPPRTDTKTASLAAVVSSDIQERTFGCGEEQEVSSGKRIMVAVDSSREAKAALQWALSHAVQSHDTVVLLDVVQPSARHEIRNAKSYEVLYAMRRLCHAKKPEVKVEVSLVQGKERGPAIVNESKLQRVSLLVLGRKKRSIRRRLLMMWTGRRSSVGESVKYCIQNADCMTLAVRRKSRRGGGYLITSRRHKDFWLLA